MRARARARVCVCVCVCVYEMRIREEMHHARSERGGSASSRFMIEGKGSFLLSLTRCVLTYCPLSPIYCMSSFSSIRYNPTLIIPILIIYALSSSYRALSQPFAFFTSFNVEPYYHHSLLHQLQSL